MCPMKVDKRMQQWFIGPALMLWTGIWLTGFDVVHWLIYIPAVMSVFALLTGMCPGMYLICKRQELFRRWEKGA